jgi:hypothetical protein
MTTSVQGEKSVELKNFFRKKFYIFSEPGSKSRDGQRLRRASALEARTQECAHMSGPMWRK